MNEKITFALTVAEVQMNNADQTEAKQVVSKAFKGISKKDIIEYFKTNGYLSLCNTSDSGLEKIMDLKISKQQADLASITYWEAAEHFNLI